MDSRGADVSRIPLQFHTRQVVMEIVTGPIYLEKNACFHRYPQGA